MPFLHGVKDFYSVYFRIVINDFVVYATHKNCVVIGFTLRIIFDKPCRYRFFANDMTFLAKYDDLAIIISREFCIA
jgi:hypothetical protein